MEFFITGDKFEPWTPADCLSLLNLLSLCMNLDYLFEPVKDLVKNKYGREFAEKLFSSKSEYQIEKVTVLSD